MTRSETATFCDGDLTAYFEGATLVVNQESFSDIVTLWYQRRIPDLTAGTGDTGSGALKIIIPTTAGPSYVDDYYNGVVLEIVAGTLIGTTQAVTDYTGSTRTLTITGTAAISTKFGSRSLVPEEGHNLIVLGAVMQAMAKPSSDVEAEVFKYYHELKRQADKDFSAWIATRESGSSHIRITEIE